MSEARPLTILCITSYEKGQEFLRACKDQGCRVLLLTVEKFRDGDWPRESIDEMFYMPAGPAHLGDHQHRELHGALAAD